MLVSDEDDLLAEEPGMLQHLQPLAHDADELLAREVVIAPRAVIGNERREVTLRQPRASPYCRTSRKPIAAATTT